MGAPMRGLAGTAIIVILVGITACGGKGSTTTSANTSASASSTAASSAATSSPAVPASATGGTPAGDHRIGGSTQGISIEVPASYTEIPLGSASATKADISKLGLSATAQATIERDLPTWTKLNAAVAVDSKSAATAPGNFVSNINAYCFADGTNQVGSAAVASIKQAVVSEFEQEYSATNVTPTDKVIGGIPGVETTYQLSSSTVGTIDGGQLEVEVKPGRGCVVTLTTAASQFSNEILSEAAVSAQFP